MENKLNTSNSESGRPMPIEDTYSCDHDGAKEGFEMFKLHFVGLFKKKILM
jgi:hypothetical protein